MGGSDRRRTRWGRGQRGRRPGRHRGSRRRSGQHLRRADRCPAPPRQDRRSPSLRHHLARRAVLDGGCAGRQPVRDRPGGGDACGTGCHRQPSLCRGLAGGRGFATNQYDGTLTVFDPATLTVQDEIAVGDYPEGIGALPDGDGVAVANWESDTLVVVDAETLAITAEIGLPSGPRAFGQFTGRQVSP
ncbi:YncE family protein [Paracoccus sp. AK26]|uniref:YncE family protein n=1 Tax=Paracoccus sp. AK26 TaxID=2589076 RepID=UPI001427F52E|nr:hypothetical protein [Paracoccus sp. AK26]QIR86173.1 hypothetical protein FIU66_13695 [Paracoccus sp. AK26]